MSADRHWVFPDRQDHLQFERLCQVNGLNATSTYSTLLVHALFWLRPCLPAARGRAKGLARRKNRVNGGPVRIEIVPRIVNGRVSINWSVHEPLRRVHLLRQDKRKEDEDGA